jgi:hypothetical protein
VSITEEERFCSSHISHRSKATPHRVPHSLYLHHFFTKEKRAEQPYLLAWFSRVLCFSSHILCLFVDGVNVFYCSLFFCILSILSVTKYSGDLMEINLTGKDFSILLDLL